MVVLYRHTGILKHPMQNHTTTIAKLGDFCLTLSDVFAAVT
jgi:hypothetical protein